MSRLSTTLVIMLIMLNAAAGFVTVTGIADDFGIQPNVGGDDRINQVNDQSKQVTANQGAVDTLIGVFDTAASYGSNVFTILFYGPTMLKNAGVPDSWMDFLSAAIAVIVAKDVLYALSGRDL